MKRIFVLCSLMIASFSINAQVIKKVSINDIKVIMDTSTTPLIINFWASWCGPCVREIPYFDSLVAAQKQPVKLLLVSLDFATAYPNQLTSFVKKHDYKSEVLFLNEKDADYFCPIIDKRWSGELPASVFINNAKQYKQFFGMQLTRARLALELQNLVK